MTMRKNPSTVGLAWVLLGASACPGGSGDDGPAATETTGSGPGATTTDTTAGSSPTSAETSADTSLSADSTVGPDDTTETGDFPPGACGATPTFSDGIEPTAEIHVAPDGVDGPGCGAVEVPCATLEGAVALVSPGTAIRIH